ncbi:MAG TPA: TadE/TadG family type IV pilus assembly protein [Candidatus Limnocylindrales bacterium]|nr:TadE/TadG family type IV pilus assembly protein [Candidatus Limnocylindrales bacterium]
MSIRAIIRRYRERPLGQSLVEFALILPVFLVIVSTAVDLGRIAYARVTIANVAREASFQAAQTPTAYQAGQPCDPADTDANLVICRAILESSGSVVTVTPADIALSCDPACASGLGNTVTVTATGRFNLLTPVMAVFFGGTTITFTSSSTNQISTLPPLTPVAATAVPPTDTPAPSTTATAEPTATPLPDCSGVSAGFSFTKTPSSNKSPVTVTVTDTTIWNPACTTVWAWDWGDGITTYGRIQAPHVYYNAGPTNKTFIITLAVTSGVFYDTAGGYAILVKP